MRARGLAIEIDDEALRLDDGEARQLLVAAGLDPTDAELAELHGHTEGWAAGLYLAALSAKANGPGDTKARTLRGDDRLVVEYLRSELLSRLPPADLRFLMRTAVLERMSGPLCDAVLRANGSAAKLESLERSNMFVAALDRNRRWYRYHRLFHELLRVELERAEPELVPVLLARAAAWSEEHGHLDAAIGYAQEAGDVDAVARLVGQCALAAYTGGRVVTVERWLEWLEERGALGRNAVVAVVGALLATTWGRPVDAERRADLAEGASYEGTLPDGSQLIDSWLALLRAEQCRRGVARMRGDAEMALRTVAPGSLFRSSAALLVATAHVLTGDPTKADDLLARVVEDGLEVGAIEDVVVALGQRTALACGRGAWVEADEFAAHAVRLVHRFGFEAYPTSAFVSAVAARVELHRGHIRRAQDLIARADRLRPRLTYALPFLAVQTRLELARAHIAGADVDGAGPCSARSKCSSPAARRRSSRRPGRGPARHAEDDARTHSGRLDAERGGVARVPCLATHSRSGRWETVAPLPSHGEVARHGDLSEARPRRGAPRSNAPASSGSSAPATPDRDSCHRGDDDQPGLLSSHESDSGPAGPRWQSRDMPDYKEILRRLALGDEAFVASVLGMDCDTADVSRLDQKTYALARVSASLALDGASSSYESTSSSPWPPEHRWTRSSGV